ncbi:MAG: LysE family transporter [Anaerolineae bacterium]|nr:LysE family transporter [Anaerolineae bacterium]
MALDFFARGLVIGFSIAAPVGPIGVLCIRRTLADGRAHGLVSGLGAATADAIYGSIAAFGLTFVSSFLIDQQTGLRLIGGVFLCYLGIKTLLARPAEHIVQANNNRLTGAYTSTFFLTLTNPVTILSFAAIFAGVGVGGDAGDYLAAAVLVAGVFLGSAAWWLLLSGGVSLLRDAATPAHLRWINRGSGVILISFGLVALAGLIA